MRDSHAIPELDRAGLRRFGLMTGALIAGIFGLFFPWLLERAIPVWPWVPAAILAAWALAAPVSLRPVYRGWMRLALIMSRITTPIVLGIVFFVVILPFALIMRSFGRDPMARRFDPQAESYRVPSRARAPQHMERPF